MHLSRDPLSSSLPPSSLCFPYTVIDAPTYTQTYTMQPSKKHIDKAVVESPPPASSSPPDEKEVGSNDDALPHDEPHAEHTQGQSGTPDANEQEHQQAPLWIKGDDIPLLRTMETAPEPEDRHYCFFASCGARPHGYSNFLEHLITQHGLIRVKWDDSPRKNPPKYLTFCPTDRPFSPYSNRCQSCRNITSLITVQDRHEHNCPVICCQCRAYFPTRREFVEHTRQGPCEMQSRFKWKITLVRRLCADLLRMQPQPPLPSQSAGPAGPSHLIPRQSTLPLPPPPVLTTPNLYTTPDPLTDTNTTTTTPNTHITPDRSTNTNTTTTTPNTHSTPGRTSYALTIPAILNPCDPPEQPSNANPTTTAMPNPYPTPDQPSNANPTTTAMPNPYPTPYQLSSYPNPTTTTRNAYIPPNQRTNSNITIPTSNFFSTPDQLSYYASPTTAARSPAPGISPPCRPLPPERRRRSRSRSPRAERRRDGGGG
ncbi:hypothetical protein F5144DRAFT_229558 [Chaetomium tenue]|uniref:Uncharacterized protein n=1 Tax=Chaetomium tenue TaxID=1854479 RepID=A0ACB7P8C2_9PEZI|nr:hypothetical protein F5144DRAFT_229558 [Chaetomium globosum]